MENNERQNYFATLAMLDTSSKIQKKNGMDYISWATAWSAVKEKFPDASYENLRDQNGRFWFDDGHTGWVSIKVCVNGHTHIEDYPIMDFKNQSIQAAKITSADANKASKRALAKACAVHGYGISVYMNEDIPDMRDELEDLQNEVKSLMKEKCAYSNEIKDKVLGIMIAADPEANGDPKLIENQDALKKVIRQLKAIRKPKNQ